MYGPIPTQIDVTEGCDRTPLPAALVRQ